MAIFKCKMCGGQLNITDDVKIIECDYCGSTQTLPSFDNEKKNNLFNRANNLRFNKEFDKAAGVYESIVAEFPEEAEAYWGLCLCKYGIEYVDDPTTGNKVPTCHRTSTTSIMNDNDFELTCENADVVSKKVYREEAKAIDSIQKRILEVVAKEEPYDVFICYKETDDVTHLRTEDSSIAQDIYTELVKEGYKVFFSRVTLRDKAGIEYEPYIYAALSSAKVMLAIGTTFEYYDAVWVKNEWSRFLKMMKQASDKVLIPCYKNIDAYDIPTEFSNMQALDMSDVTFFKSLQSNIKRIIPKNNLNYSSSNDTSSQQKNKNIKEIKLSDGGLYKGESLAGQPHGVGICIYESGDKYSGEYAFGKYNGKGKYTYANGSYYEGEFQKGYWEGSGSFYSVDGSICNGEFTQGKFWNCSGAYKYSDSRFEGTWIQGKRTGKGKISWDNGGIWEGDFKDDLPYNGSGTWKYDDSWFEGTFLNGLRHGKGVLRWLSGGSCEGEFNNGIFTGSGKWMYSDGYYEGAFINGKREGEGVFFNTNENCKFTGTFKDDQLYNGKWSNGVLVENGVNVPIYKQEERSRNHASLIIIIIGLLIYIIMACTGASYWGAGIFGLSIGIAILVSTKDSESIGALIMFPIIALIFNFILNLFI